MVESGESCAERIAAVTMREMRREARDAQHVCVAMVLRQMRAHRASIADEFAAGQFGTTSR